MKASTPKADQPPPGCEGEALEALPEAQNCMFEFPTYYNQGMKGSNDYVILWRT